MRLHCEHMIEQFQYFRLLAQLELSKYVAVERERPGGGQLI